MRRQLGLIRHRGPDAFGIFLGKHAGIVSSRLRIIDLVGGDQPIHNEEKNIWVVYNGEIFNYPELRGEVEKRGHRFYTQTDTEILVHLYEDEGTNFFNKLNGQFALALWDQKKQQLLLLRDRLGIRPLFYYHVAGRLVFGSEIKAIFADPEIPRTMNLQTLSDIFTCWSPMGCDTAFKDIKQLMPGHFGVFSRGGLSTQAYWQLSFSNGFRSRRSQDSSTSQPLAPCFSDSLELSESPGTAAPSLDDLTAELQHLLTDATRIRLRADVPVGAYLSGGLDSTYLTSLVKKNYSNRLRTFSVCFSDNKFDEAPFQNKVVERLQTDHSMIRCAEQDIGANLPRVIWHAEVPLLRTGPIPLFLLSQLVRENNFKVVLTGEGADEIFAGYDIFKEDRVRRFWARNSDSKMRPLLLQRLYPDIFKPGNSRGRSFVMRFFRKGLLQIKSADYSHMIRWENTSQIKSFFSKEVANLVEAKDNLGNRFRKLLPDDFMNWNPLSRAQYTEMTIFLSNYLLSSQGDRVAMGHAVEGRFPFLDYRVVEFAAKIPPRYLLNGLKDKFILRRSAKNLIPEELALRAKQPYRAPISRCFWGEQAQPYLFDLLTKDAIRTAGYFDEERVSRLMAKCQKQEGHLLSERENMAVVGIISTQLLHQQFIANFPGVPIEEPKEIKIYRA